MNENTQIRVLNPDILYSHGNVHGRKDILEILEASLQAADPYNNTCKLIRVKRDKLIIGSPDFEVTGAPKTGEEVVDLTKLGKILVIGAGKGVQRVAKAIEDILGDRLTGGHVIDKYGAPLILDRIGVTFGAHPVPDENCIAGCREIQKLCQGLKPIDMVFTIAANGISSLLTYPIPGVSLEDIQRTTYLMQIERGVPTQELNPIRNHLDLMKGGRVSMMLQPAKAIHLIVYDPDGFGRYESGWSEFIEHNVWLHTLPDSTTFIDAIGILKKWNAWDVIPAPVSRHLLEASPKFETIKPPAFLKTWFRIFGLMPRKIGMMSIAQEKARELGYTPHILCNRLETEAGITGEVVATIACSVEREGVPFEPPCALFTWGEMVVTVGDSKGIGGRNQEYVLSAARKIDGSKNIIMAAVDTDGTDGPGTQFAIDDQTQSTLAGGIVDGMTATEIRNAGIDIMSELRHHNTTPVLVKLRDGIYASHSISLSDFGVTLVAGRSKK